MIKLNIFLGEYMSKEISKREEYRHAGLKFCREMGYIPSLTDFKINQKYPDPNKVKKEYGTWKEFIKECNFPFGFEKKNNDTVYLGRHSWFSQDYYEDLKNMNFNLLQFLKNITNSEIKVDIIHKQMIFVFIYENKKYAVSYLNMYIDDYSRKIKIIKECLEDMDVHLINLNSNYKWWQKQIKKELDIDDKH